MPTHELHLNRNGTYSLRELQSGEVMHSSVGPREEASLLYIDQSSLRTRLARSLAERTQGGRSSIDDSELVLLDVGLGAGTNALAALTAQREAASQGKTRKLRIISFETDPSGIALALANKDKFPFFEGFENAAETLVRTHHWRSPDGALEWELRVGHFLENLAGLSAPELVFFDFYSPNVVPHLWGVSMFQTVMGLANTEPRPKNGTSLYTYSASTRVRVALLLAGFYVGYGRNTGAKLDTTVASTQLQNLERPLDRRWLERLERSHASLPFDWPSNATSQEQRVEMLRRVFELPQFIEQANK